MTRAAATIASEADLLCEQCGYTLNGLSETGNCPECGTPVAFSTSQTGRTLPAWERERCFWTTTANVLFRTSRFYRTLRTRVPAEQHRLAYGFAMRHWFLGGFLAALASGIHYSLTQGQALPAGWDSRTMLILLWVALVTGLAGLAAMGVTHLAVRLTAWEAAWRGYRLPRDVVLRGLCYHAAHLLPVTAGMLLIVIIYRIVWAAGVVSFQSIIAYLVILSVAVVAGAGYLFWTYWIGMRNMLFANI